jgi:hypothetical protein
MRLLIMSEALEFAGGQASSDAPLKRAAELSLDTLAAACDAVYVWRLVEGGVPVFPTNSRPFSSAQMPARHASLRCAGRWSSGGGSSPPAAAMPSRLPRSTGFSSGTNCSWPWRTCGAWSRHWPAANRSRPPCQLRRPRHRHGAARDRRRGAGPRTAEPLREASDLRQGTLHQRSTLPPGSQNPVMP